MVDVTNKSIRFLSSSFITKLIHYLGTKQQKSYLEYVLDVAHKKSGKCEVTLMKEEIVTSLDAMAVQKHSPYLAQIDLGYYTTQT